VYTYSKSSKQAENHESNEFATTLIKQATHAIASLLADECSPLSTGLLAKVKALKSTLHDCEQVLHNVSSKQSKQPPNVLGLPIGRTRLFPPQFRLDVRIGQICSRGRGLYTTHSFNHGALLLVAHPYACTIQNPTDKSLAIKHKHREHQQVIRDVWLDSRRQPHNNALSSLIDDGTLALALQTLAQRANEKVQPEQSDTADGPSKSTTGAKGGRVLKFCDIQDLVSHFAPLRLNRPATAAALLSLAACLCEHPLAQTEGLTPQQVSELLLQIHFNAFPLCDETQTPSQTVPSRSKLRGTRPHKSGVFGGIGLFPAAAYINHSSIPNCMYCIRRDNTIDSSPVLELRALSFIHADEELVMSYVDPYLCSNEQSTLLVELGIPGPFGTPSLECNRPTSTQQNGCDAYQKLDKSVWSLAQASMGANDIGSLRDKATAAHNAIDAMEKILPKVATLRLASCYFIFAQALLQIHGKQQQRQRQQQAEQNVNNIGAAFKAAYRIRLCCLGEHHPVVQHTLEAMTLALQAIGVLKA
jgi:hypothetical protein